MADYNHEDVDSRGGEVYRLNSNQLNIGQLTVLLSEEEYHPDKLFYGGEKHPVLHTICSSMYPRSMDGSMLRMAQLLLSYGADIETLSQSGDTPLISASFRNRPQLAELLTSSGANVNYVSDKGTTALQCAAKHGNLDLIVKLINAGAEVQLGKASNEVRSMEEYMKGNPDLRELVDQAVKEYGRVRESNTINQNYEMMVQTDIRTFLTKIQVAVEI